ncbi:hypothetical protein M231_00793 [Tremella mesenterica]|uniref:Protein arginine methyltransferase NDUFAF7 n=1 Tax=Tremella mesenterica TaxID=5217 RepID=A0A4Q1BV92_TREME|nr:hypothetical protein M231_00793 [Tremella mesenterica]
MSCIAGPSRFAIRQTTSSVFPVLSRVTLVDRKWPPTRPLRRPVTTSRPKQDKPKSQPRYNFNTSLNFTEEPDPDHVNYRRVTASDLAKHEEPPTRVKMLVRDFIDDSLYNPHYGYFSKNATIFTPPQEEGYDFTSFRDTAAFSEAVADRYESYNLVPTEQSGLGRQVWHTPTELFKPYYAQALISAILKEYKLYHYPHQDLIIYEVGAGNGSFMLDSLRFIRDHHPDIFIKTKYRVIEISQALAKVQRDRARKAGFRNVVEVINEDVFNWQGGEDKSCFVIALEVFDNFAHDMIRYDIQTLQPLQATVSIDSFNNFTLLYEPISDPLLQRVLQYKHLLSPSSSTSPPLHPLLLRSPLLRSIWSTLPFGPNLSQPDFIPTKAILFLERLRARLPAHRLLVADFDALPEAVIGRNGPVVQTRYGSSMVPCETFLVKQGYFDIFFPTDFSLLRNIYSLIMNSPPHLPISKIHSSTSLHLNPSPNPTSNQTNIKILPQSMKPSRHSNPPNVEPPSPAVEWSSQTIIPFFTPHRLTGVQGFRRRQVGIHTHSDFLLKYGRDVVDHTKVKDGSNVMLSMYDNSRVMF